MMICRHNWVEVFHYGGIYNKVVGDPVTDEIWGSIEVHMLKGNEASFQVICGDYMTTFAGRIIRQGDDEYLVKLFDLGGLSDALLSVLAFEKWIDGFGVGMYRLHEEALNKFIKRWEVILDFLKP